MSVDNYNKFQTELNAGGPVWNEAGTGTYTIIVLYATAARTAETTFQFGVTGTTTQPSITISTDKSLYKENEGMYVTYVISERIPNEELSIKLYDPNDRYTSGTIITDYGLSSQLTSYTTFFPVDNRWDVGGVYTIIAEYAGSKKILTVEVITSSEGSTTQQSITVSTGKLEYKEGDTIKISGQVETFLEGWPPVTITIIDPTGEVVTVASDQPSLGSGYSVWLTAGEDVNIDGKYTVNVFYNTQAITASTTFQYAAAGSTDQSTCDLNSSNHPTVVLDIFRSNQIDRLGQVLAGETIVLTGRLVCESGYKHSNVEIIIFENHLIDSDETLVTTYTDTNGEFSVPWVVTTDDIIRQVTTIQAKYETEPLNGGLQYKPTSEKRVIQIDRQLAEISLDPLPKSAEIGETLFFTGKLELASGDPEGYIIYIKDEDPFEEDDLLATGYVESDGSFSPNWIVTITDGDRITDVYAVFEGAGIYWRVTTCDYGITKPLGGACQETIPLQITGELPPPPPPPTGPLDSDNDGIPDDRDQCKFTSETYNGYLDADGCPDTPPEVPEIVDSDGDGINDNFDSCPFVAETFNGYQDHDGCPDTIPKPVPKENLNGDEYINFYYSHSFNKNPVVAIVPAPDSYDEVRRYIIPTQDGVMLWGNELAREFGGDWNVDFIIIEPGTPKFPTKPDIIMQVVTRDEVVGCDTEFGGVAYLAYGKDGSGAFYPSTPINTIVCTNNYGVFRSTSSLAGTSAHEFIHAIGLGHTFNKPNDLMCSFEYVNGQKIDTCSSSYNKSNMPSDFNLAAVKKLYKEDGWKNPNFQVYSYGEKLTADQYMNFEYSLPVTPITSTPEPEPTPIMEKVPGWIKNNAKWWAESQIGDSDFVSGIQFMIKEKIINIPNLPEQASETAEEKVPDWIRNNAGWWADGLISEDDFVGGIKWLVENGIIKV